MRPTGVTIIDRAIGGFPSQLPLLVAVPSGRTALALELAFCALARGEAVRFLTPDASASLLREAEALGFDLAPAFDAGRLEILELHGDAPKLLREHGIDALADALVAGLEGAALIVVDPFSALVAEIEAASQLRAITRAFANAVRDHDVVLTIDPERLSEHHGLAAALHEISGAWFPQTDERRAVRDASGAMQRPTILVVDDDRLQREMLRDWLAPLYEVICVGDGFEALSTLAAQQPDLVVLDLLMPRVSGYELLQSMRRARFEMPVLVTSARVATTGERLGPLVLGATEFLAKPVARVELLHKVEMLLRLPQSGAAPRFGASQADAEALFGTFSHSRLLESAEFADRIRRACEFGRKVDLSSCLVGISAESGAALDRWIDVADRHLRYEDAILRVDKGVAAILLVATDPRYGARAVERLLTASGAPLPPIETEFWTAGPEHAAPGAVEMLLDPLRRPSEATS